MLKYGYTKEFFKELRETKMWTEKGEEELKKVIEEFKNGFKL